MQLSELIQLFQHHPGVRALTQCWNEQQALVFLDGLQGSAAPVMLAATAQTAQGLFMVVLNDRKKQDISTMICDNFWETNPFYFSLLPIAAR